MHTIDGLTDMIINRIKIERAKLLARRWGERYAIVGDGRGIYCQINLLDEYSKRMDGMIEYLLYEGIEDTDKVRAAMIAAFNEGAQIGDVAEMPD